MLPTPPKLKHSYSLTSLTSRFLNNSNLSLLGHHHGHQSMLVNNDDSLENGGDDYGFISFRDQQQQQKSTATTMLFSQGSGCHRNGYGDDDQRVRKCGNNNCCGCDCHQGESMVNMHHGNDDNNNNNYQQRQTIQTKGNNNRVRRTLSCYAKNPDNTTTLLRSKKRDLQQLYQSQQQLPICEFSPYSSLSTSGELLVGGASRVQQQQQQSGGGVVNGGAFAINGSGGGSDGRRCYYGNKSAVVYFHDDPVDCGCAKCGRVRKGVRERERERGEEQEREREQRGNKREQQSGIGNGFIKAGATTTTTTTTTINTTSNNKNNKVPTTTTRNNKMDQIVTNNSTLLSSSSVDYYKNPPTTQEVVADGNNLVSSWPLTPEEAVGYFASRLTSWELSEIGKYPQTWYLGQEAVRKINGEKANPLNCGFDDENGNYHKVTHDHLSYRYEILEIIGKGSFGQVIRATDHKTNQTQVAIKIIRNKKRFHAQALVEVKILEHLRKRDHDNTIIRMYSSFYFRNHLCIVFELMSLNLYELIRRNHYHGFSTGLIKKFAVSLLKCLALLKKENIIHCDLKPENILLRRRGSSAIKVIDFGSSCFGHERVFSYIQSRFYRAPEVILGIPYTTAIDVWSLGCVLAELSTGYPLFPGENEVEQLSCIMETLGLPPEPLITVATRRRLFFDSRNQPRCIRNSKGKIRRPGTRDLSSSITKAAEEDLDFISFLRKCLTWDPSERLTPSELLMEPWITSTATTTTTAGSTTSSGGGGGAATVGGANNNNNNQVLLSSRKNYV